MQGKFVFDYSALIGRIVEIYGKREAFAKAIGMTPATLSHKLTGKAEWRQEEIKEACHVLNIPPEEVGKYWFREKGETKWRWQTYYTASAQ